MYYHLNDKYLYHPNGGRCEMLWTGYNKDGALEKFEMYKNVEKYNL